MLLEIKKCADSNDIKGLRYIFVDCLDVDPTFEKYKEDYEYCKQIPGFFEDYTEITTLTDNQSMWDKRYWEVLKTELLKNFSEKRFQHMIKVAKVVYAEKVDKLTKERKIIEEKQRELERANKEFEEKQAREEKEREEKRRKLQEYSVKKTNNTYEDNNQVQKVSKKQRDDEKLKEKRRKLERANKEFEEKQAREEKEREEKRKASANKCGVRNNGPVSDSRYGTTYQKNNEQKKLKGVVPIAILVVMIVLIILLILVLK